MASMEYENEQRGYDGVSPLPYDTHPRPAMLTRRADEPRGGYDRERSRSPRGDRRDMDDSRARSASPIGRDSR